MNLALNARDAMPRWRRPAHRDQPQPWCCSPSRCGHDELPPGRYVTFSRSATPASGIPPELLPRIFEPFFTTRREQGGQRARPVHRARHRAPVGRLHRRRRARLGEGTTFRIWLPRHDGPAEDAEATSRTRRRRRWPRPAPRAQRPSASRRPILLVEDEAAPAAPGRARADAAPASRCSTATSAEEALELLEAGAPKPVALVSDVVMPGHGRARRWPSGCGTAIPDLPVLLVSGYAEAALGRDLAAEAAAPAAQALWAGGPGRRSYARSWPQSADDVGLGSDSAGLVSTRP